MNHDETLSSACKDRQTKARPMRAGVLLCAALNSLPATVAAGDLNLTFHDVERAGGTLRVAVYASESDFRTTTLRSVATPAVVGDTRVTIEDLPAGDYAVLVYQDLNDNNELDTNLLGLPTEPWSGSLNSKSMFGPPSWNDARFTLAADGGEVTIDMSGAE